MVSVNALKVGERCQIPTPSETGQPGRVETRRARPDRVIAKVKTESRPQTVDDTGGESRGGYVAVEMEVRILPGEWHRRLTTLASHPRVPLDRIRRDGSYVHPLSACRGRCGLAGGKQVGKSDVRG
jgi:hypothetical protein